METLKTANIRPVSGYQGNQGSGAVLRMVKWLASRLNLIKLYLQLLGVARAEICQAPHGQHTEVKITRSCRTLRKWRTEDQSDAASSHLLLAVSNHSSAMGRQTCAHANRKCIEQSGSIKARPRKPMNVGKLHWKCNESKPTYKFSISLFQQMKISLWGWTLVIFG